VHPNLRKKKMAASVTSALTEAQTATLSTIVRRLRCVLPDPSARDIYDTIAEQDQAMSVWASASRVKKVNTSHNKEVKHADYSRDGLEPDETNGPLVLDTLAKWPADTPVFFCLAANGETRIFRPGEHHVKVEGESDEAKGDEDASEDDAKKKGKKVAGLRFRQSLVAAAKLFDTKIHMWKLVCVDNDANQKEELVVVCTTVKRLPNESDKKANASPRRAAFQVEYASTPDREKNAHKRNLTEKLTEHAGAVGELIVTQSTMHTWRIHLERNRHYEDKYGGTLGGSFWDRVVGERDGDERFGNGDGESQNKPWRSSFIVTPSAEWFR
jgi:hypothetical protein